MLFLSEAKSSFTKSLDISSLSSGREFFQRVKLQLSFQLVQKYAFEFSFILPSLQSGQLPSGVLSMSDA